MSRRWHLPMFLVVLLVSCGDDVVPVMDIIVSEDSFPLDGVIAPDADAAAVEVRQDTQLPDMIQQDSGIDVSDPDVIIQDVPVTDDGVDAVDRCWADGECDDSNICTTDWCSDEGVCLHDCVCTAVCHQDEDCQAGICKQAACRIDSGSGTCISSACEVSDKDCDDGDPCTNDSCSMQSGACRHEKISGCGRCQSDTECSDLSDCTVDYCDVSTGDCVFQAVDCADGDVCTSDSCVPGFGCVHLNTCACANDGQCGDSNACTTETCDLGLGECVYTLISCDDGVQCTVDSCDPTRGCLNVPAGDLCEEAPDCDDGDECTVDRCQSGCCVFEEIPECKRCSTDEECDDGDPCTLDGCNTDVFFCLHVASSGACSDNNPCTIGDQCVAGTCVPGSIRSCDDDNQCTVDYCGVDGACVNQNIADCQTCDGPEGCDDGSDCTMDSCVEGVCRYSRLVCDDGNDCTDDICRDDGGCVSSNNTATCDDDDICTISDICVDGECVGGTGTAECSDGNQCTADYCDPVSGCYSVNEDLPCEDGDPCTLNDQCVFGECVSGTGGCNDNNLCTIDKCKDGVGCQYLQVDCNDRNACTIDSCDPDTGCVNTPVVVDDGDACTVDSCDQTTGVISRVPVECDDKNLCTVDSCDTSTGCVFNEKTCPAGPCMVATCDSTTGLCGEKPLDCNDSNLCTIDSCDPAGIGVCVHQDKVCEPVNPCDEVKCEPSTGECVFGMINCDDGNACTTDVCGGDGKCAHTPVNGACSDGDMCTTGDRCVNGECKPVGVLDCPDKACNSSWCDSETGCTYEAVQDGLPCNDASFCTSGDRCQAGLCVGDPTASCDDGNPCTTDYCDPVAGCVNENNTATCDDGLVCTENDVCSNGTCGGSAVQCPNDNDQCTNDYCLEGFGCVNEAHTSSCDDGLQCTENDVCDINGQCKGQPVVCSSANSCLSGMCVEGLGCTFAMMPDNTPCDDFSACTTGEKCAAGACGGGAAVNCNDGIDCTRDACDPAAGCVHTLKDNCRCYRDNANCFIQGVRTCCEYDWGDVRYECTYDCG